MAKLGTKDLIDRARGVIDRQARAVAALKEQMDDKLAQLTEIMVNCKGHILVTGAGTSRAVAQRFAHLLACCGTAALFINAADALHGGAGAVTPNDVLFVISKAGRSEEINKFAQIAKARGAGIIALTENDNSPLSAMSDVLYKIKAPDDIDPYGMIATASSLVNAAACDVLCVLLLELTGYTKEQFGATHPEGAVGGKLAHKQE